MSDDPRRREIVPPPRAPARGATAAVDVPCAPPNNRNPAR
jgi:hypothetical protein